MSTTPSRILSVEWLADYQRDAKVVIVDVRPRDQYDAGHIPHARNIDIYPLKILDSDSTAIDQWMATIQEAFQSLGIQQGDHVVFYEDISGTSAARGVWLMEALSIGRGSMLDGGMAAWHAAGHPYSSEPVATTPSDLTVKRNDDVFATASDILESLQDDNGTRIIDTRNLLEWIQGTIPTATHLDWAAHLNAEGTLRPLDELRAMYQDLDLSHTDDIVTFCASGYRAAHTWLILSELGYPQVRNYAPSWGEWSRRSDVHVEMPDQPPLTQ